jgi:hypothetical protein
MAGLLERLELRTNRVFWSDGVLDLLAAAALLSLGISWVADAAVYGAIVPAVFVALWRPIRRTFTEPRLGCVELGEAREARNRSFMGLMLSAGVLTFGLGLGVYFAQSNGMDVARVLIPALPGALVGIAGIATAEALGLRRFFVYGGLSLSTGIAVAIVPDLNPGWAFVAAGTAALIGGCILATRFVARYPRPGVEG